MFLKPPLSQLSAPARYILYVCLPVSVWLGLIQCHKLYRSRRGSVVTFDTVHKAVQRKDWQKKKGTFSATEYIENAALAYLQACRAESVDAYRYGYYVHEHLGDFVTEHTDLITSMRKHHPMMDKETYMTLNVFLGTEDNLARSFCNLFARKVGIQTAIGKYHLFLMLVGANKDPERIKRYQEIQVGMMRDAKRLYKLKGALQRGYEKETFKDIMHYYLRDKYPSKPMQLVKVTTRAEYLVPKGLLALSDAVGFNLRKELEESKIGSWTLKWMHLHLADIEHIFKLDRVWEDMKRSWYTWVSFFHFIGLASAPQGQGHTPASLSGGTIVMGINRLWKGLTWLFRKNPQPLVASDSIEVLDWLYLAITAPMFLMKYMVKEPFDIVNNRFYEAYQNTFGEKSRYAVYTEAINEGLHLLKQVERLVKLMRKFEKTLGKDKALTKLCASYLKPIRYLLHSAEDLPHLHYILKEVAGLEDRSVTAWQLRMSMFSPTDTWITDILRLVKRLDELPEEEEKALMSAMTAFCMLETFVSVAAFAHENEMKKSSYGFVLAEIIDRPDKSKVSTPDIDLKDAYTIFIPLKKVVKNDFHNVRDPKTGEEKIKMIEGLNGAGKSMAMRTQAEGHILIQSLGCAFAGAAKVDLVDHMRFHANIKDSKEDSLMMADAKRINEILLLADRMQDGEQGLFFFDEPCKGTTTDEGRWLVLSFMAYLQQTGRVTTVLSTHINSLFEIAERVGYNKLAPFTPGFDRKEGFTYKITEGRGKYPVCVHVLEKIHFHPGVLEATVNLLADDPNYRFRSKLRPTSNRSFIDALLGSRGLEYGLLLLLILMIGMLVGMYLPRRIGSWVRDVE